MTTEKDIQDMYLHLRSTNQSIPDEALEFMKQTCLEALKSHSFTSTALPFAKGGENEVAVWTDGVALSSDNEENCEYPLKKGSTYKISILKVS